MKNNVYKFKKCSVCLTPFILKPLEEGEFRISEDECSWACFNFQSELIGTNYEIDPLKFSRNE